MQELGSGFLSTLYSNRRNALAAAGVTFCQAQTPAATMSCESSTSMVTLNLIDFNLPNTPPSPSTPSTGGAISQSGFMQGFVDAPMNSNLAAFLGDGSTAQPPLGYCWLTPPTGLTTWEVILNPVMVTGIQFSSAPAAQGSSAPPQPFVRIAMEYAEVSIGFPAGYGAEITPSPVSVPAPTSGLPSGSTPSTGLTPAPTSSQGTSTSTSN